MSNRFRLFSLAMLLCSLWIVPRLGAQQTLGGITGAVLDDSGAAIPAAIVTIVGNETKLTRSQDTNEAGTYDFVNLPIGSYSISVSHSGFQMLQIPAIQVQANRTATVNVTLKIGDVRQTITVEEAPLVNVLDAANIFVLEKQQIDSIPIPNGSFTQLVVLSPGVNAELSSGTGANAGLGNAPIWANGQRDTSNTFLLDGVDASNLFNGKSTSSVASARIVNSTGSAGLSPTSAEIIQSSASPYQAIGQALPSPPPEFLQEVRINSSMYDAQQGSTSGAHIDLSTSSGTNTIHGSAYLHRGTDALNAASYFYKTDANIPPDEKVPELHRYAAGGTLGGPLIKEKLFGYVGYQHLHDSDQEIGISRLAVPSGLSSMNRTAQGLADLSNEDFGSTITASQVSPVALALMQFKLPNGQYMIPNDDHVAATDNFPEDASVLGTAYFIADQAVADLDWTASPRDVLALKYFYQHDPTTAPFAYSSVPGFTQHLDAGSQVATITNTQTLTPHLSIVEIFGFIREKIYSSLEQPFTLSKWISIRLGPPHFRELRSVDMLGNDSPGNINFVQNAGMNIGMGAEAQSAFTGVFQNRFMPSAAATWPRGRHTVTFGGSYADTQLNVRDDRPNRAGTIGFADFSQFLQGLVTPYSSYGFITTSFLQGDASRYYRAGQTGEYLQDRFQATSNLSLTFGLRFDWNGGLKEKYGRLYNFDPSQYSYDENTGDITSTGFVVAGNNPRFPTPGVSDTTLTGRQWGIAPRIGLAWSPKKFDGKVAVRAGWGIYYDRGELFTYLSPGFAAGVIAGGPFGVNQAPPYVNAQECSAIGNYYEGFIPTCDPNSPNGGSFANPWGATLGPAPTGDPTNISQLLPNRDAILAGAPLFSFGIYNRANRLPYTMNETLDLQWQPREDLAIDIGYVGNLGRHEVVPLPFNQAQIASPTHPIHGQEFSYGYTVLDNNFNPLTLPNGQGQMLATYEGGNIDLRVPYVGYSAESESYTAVGVSAYNALQAHLEKRLSHGLQAEVSYTYSHSLDDQSAMGLFYNGDNPLNLRDAYGNSDFDRRHVITFSYSYEMHNFFSESIHGRPVCRWLDDSRRHGAPERPAIQRHRLLRRSRKRLL